MKRLVLVLALMAAPMLSHAAPLPAADQAELAQVQAYLNGVHTLKARFLQLAPDGGTNTGTAWLERPGRMRFQYDPPSPLLLVAGHGLVVFHDSELQQTSNIPLGSTPLGILLRANVQLSGDVTVTAVNHLPGEVEVTLIRTVSPRDGSLTLVFTENPLALRQWTVLDAQHRQTRVTLYDVATGGKFAPGLFDYVDPNVFSNPH